jgi:hypothetical protein
MGKEVLSSELEADKKGEGSRSEVRGFRNFELRTQNFESRLSRFSRKSRESRANKENRHETHYSRESFPVSLCGTWC